MDKNDFMRLALLEAEKAFLDGEVPVGAVIVRDGEVVSTGRNRREKGKKRPVPRRNRGYSDIHCFETAEEMLDSGFINACIPRLIHSIAYFG